MLVWIDSVATWSFKQQWQKTLHQHWTTYCPGSCTFGHRRQPFRPVAFENQTNHHQRHAWHSRSARKYKHNFGQPQCSAFFLSVSATCRPTTHPGLTVQLFHAQNKQRWDKDNALHVSSESQVLVLKSRVKCKDIFKRQETRQSPISLFLILWSTPLSAGN